MFIPPGTKPLLAFCDGIMLMAFCIAALIFLRFWRKTHDRFFLLFSLAFWAMAVNRIALSVASMREPEDIAEKQFLLYLVRLAAFALLLVAIIDKNRSRRWPQV